MKLLEIREVANGGFIVQDSYKACEYYYPTIIDALKAIMEHFKPKDSKEE